MVILSPFRSAGHAVKTDVGEAEQIEMLRRRVRQRRSTTIEFHSLPRRMHGRTDGRIGQRLAAWNGNRYFSPLDISTADFGYRGCSPLAHRGYTQGDVTSQSL